MKKLVCHLYYGDPSEEFSCALAKTLLENGADILEIGIPYSDPVSDGPVFQAACARALEGGMSPIRVIRGIRHIREQGYTQPIYVTSYYGPIFKIGDEKFIKLVKNSGADGVIIPDLLFEEQKEFLKIAKRFGISVIQFATPYTTEERLKTIIRHARDFLYCISVPGVTGAQKTIIDKIPFLKRIKSFFNHNRHSGKPKQSEGASRIRSWTSQDDSLPLFVGFGISTPEQVKDVIQSGADGVIIGSAIARMYEKNLDNPEKTLPKIASFIQKIKRSMVEP